MEAVRKMVVGLSTGARPIFFDGERLDMLPTAVYIPTLPPVATELHFFTCRHPLCRELDINLLIWWEIIMEGVRTYSCAAIESLLSFEPCWFHFLKALPNVHTHHTEVQLR